MTRRKQEGCRGCGGLLAPPSLECVPQSPALSRAVADCPGQRDLVPALPSTSEWGFPPAAALRSGDRVRAQARPQASSRALWLLGGAALWASAPQLHRRHRFSGLLLGLGTAQDQQSSLCPCFASARAVLQECVKTSAVTTLDLRFLVSFSEFVLLVAIVRSSRTWCHPPSTLIIPGFHR